MVTLPTEAVEAVGVPRRHSRDDAALPMLQRNLLYTGVTRGKKLVVLVGQKKALAIAVCHVSGGGAGRS